MAIKYFLLSCLFLMFALTAKAASVAESTAGSAKEYVVAFAQDTLKNDFRRAQVFDVRDRLQEHKGVRFLYSDAQGKTSLLMHQINEFVSQQVDVLIVGTNDAELVVPVIENAHERGVRVLILDRGVNTTRYTSFLNSDNVLIGQIAGRFIADELKGRGQVLLMEGIKTADVTRDRTQGFLNVMAEHPGIEVISRTGNYLRKDALLEMEKLVAEGVHVDAIFSESDSMLSGVRAVMERHQIDPESIITVGCDYTSEAKIAIEQGDQTGSVLFPLGGKETVNAILTLKAGKELPSHINIPVNTLVTKGNVDHVRPVF